MALVLKEFTLDIVPKKAPQIIDVSENDINRDYKINLTNDGATYTIPSGTSATIEGTIDKENGFSQDAIVSSNAILFSLTEEMTAKRGRFWTKVKLEKDNKPLSTCGFWLNVDRAGISSEALVNLTGFEKVLQKKFEDYIDEHGTAAPDAGVNSVNGKAGVVTLRLSDIENDTKYIPESDTIYNSQIVPIIHNYEHAGDTTWILLKIPKSKYKLSFHHCSGDDTNSPTTLTSNPKAWLENHPNYIISHNCNFGGAEWGSRWNGIEYERNHTYSYNRNYFAFDSDTEECAYYPSTIYNTTNRLAAIPEKYDIVFACGDWLVQNGTARASSYTNDNGTFPRTCFGWDDNYYYIFSC